MHSGVKFTDSKLKEIKSQVKLKTSARRSSASENPDSFCLSFTATRYRMDHSKVTSMQNLEHTGGIEKSRWMEAVRWGFEGHLVTDDSIYNPKPFSGVLFSVT